MRRYLQFSLLTLFILITLCAMGLAWWFSRPPRVNLVGSDTWRMGDPVFANATAYLYKTQRVELRGPRVNRAHGLFFLVIAPPGESQAPNLSHDIPSRQPWLVHWIAWPKPLLEGEETKEGTSYSSFTFIYNAAQDTIAYDDTSLECPPQSLIVIEFADDGQASLKIDDGSFENVNLHSSDLEQVRDAYTRSRSVYEE